MNIVNFIMIVKIYYTNNPPLIIATKDFKIQFLVLNFSTILVFWKYLFSNKISDLLFFLTKKDFKACTVLRTFTHKLFRGCCENSTEITQIIEFMAASYLALLCYLARAEYERGRLFLYVYSLGLVSHLCRNTTTASTE